MFISDKEYFTFDDVLIYPRQCPVVSRYNIDLTTQLCNGIILKTPIVSANMISITENEMAYRMYELGGLGVLHRFMDYDKFATQITKLLEKTIDKVAFSIGIRDKDKSIETLNHAYELRKIAGLNKSVTFIVFIDVAHGHDYRVLEMAKLAKQYPNTKVIAGNVATKEAAKFLNNSSDIDGIKVGIGNGSACKTRSVAGAGVPFLSSIIECAEVSRVPIIADGGFRSSGDIVKALAAGASCIMTGRLLAGTDEAAVRSLYSGSYSNSRIQENIKLEKHTEHIPAAEGVDIPVSDNGPIHTIIDELTRGIKSGLSYAGAKSIKQLQEECIFIKQTHAAKIEGDVRH